MQCRTIEKHILAYIKNELPQEIRIEFEDHLKNCPKCAGLVQKFGSTWKLIEAPEKITASPYFWAGIQQRMSEKKSWGDLILEFSNRLSRWTRPAFATIAVVAGIYLGYLLGNLGQFDYQTVYISSSSKSMVEDYFNASYIPTLKSMPNTSFESIYLNMVLTEKEEK
ncbi:zf-HC2 domain-containing protein [candidate division KSB1 bacterium]|nr:zf-HC2 domain-containing protein [candidate division KSB1 bacterium]